LFGTGIEFVFGDPMAKSLLFFSSVVKEIQEIYI